MNHRIEQAKKFLWEKLMVSGYFKDHQTDGEYRYEHSIRVANIGKTIAEKEGLNVENLMLGCLLHDVSYCMSFEEMGGWNTVTLCEDTEFAAMSTKLGYRVAWVPEALSYDEQVAKFGVSMRQRRRWCRGMVQCARRLTGAMFSGRCPKKGMARDFGMLFITSHTAPLGMVVMFLSMPFLEWWMILLNAGGAVLSLVGLMLLAVVLCWLGGYPVRRMWKAIVMFPVFMISWFPLQLMALFVPVKQWSVIEHNGQDSAAELSDAGA